MVLVTGATGFLGTELIKQLCVKGYSIRALYRNVNKRPKDLKDHPNISWLQADINNFEAMNESLKNITQVYHCAAKVVIDENAKKEQFKTNIDGTAQLVNLCLAIPNIKLVHVSSIAALGNNTKDTLINENAKWEFEPKSNVYSISKFESELEVWRGIAEGLNAVIVNPSLIIGGSDKNSLSTQLKDMVLKKLPFYPKGGIGVIDVKDVAQCMIQLMESDISAERFILSAENYSYKSLFETFANALSIKAPKFPIGKIGLFTGYYLAKTWQIISKTPNPLSKDIINSISENLYVDNQKIITNLNYQFIPIKESIAASCNHKL